MDNDTIQKELTTQKEMGYFNRLLRATDMWLNVLLSGNLDDTISSHIARSMLSGSRASCYLCKFLNIIFSSKDHCREALDADSARAIIEQQRDLNGS